MYHTNGTGYKKDQPKMYDWSICCMHCTWNSKRVSGADEARSQRMTKNAIGLKNVPHEKKCRTYSVSEQIE